MTQDSAQTIGTLWSYAEGNATALGVVVGLVAIAALGLVGQRLIEQLRSRRRR